MPISDIIMNSLTQAGENIARGMRHAGALRENKFWSDQADLKRKANTESDRAYEKQLHTERLAENVKIEKDRLKTANKEYYRKQALAEAKAAMDAIDELDATGKSYFKDATATRREIEDKMAQIRADNFDPEDFDAVPDSFHAGIKEYRGEQARASALKASREAQKTQAETSKLLAEAADHKDKRYAMFDGELRSVEELDDMAKSVNAQTESQTDPITGKITMVLTPDKAKQRNRILDAKLTAEPYDNVVKKATSALTTSNGLGPLAPKYVREYNPAGVPDQNASANPGYQLPSLRRPTAIDSQVIATPDGDTLIYEPFGPQGGSPSVKETLKANRLSLRNMG